MDIKKLIKLYEEYKKIGQPKEYNKGGSVSKEHDKNNLKRLEKSFDMFMQEEKKEKSKGYYDGTSDGKPVEGGLQTTKEAVDKGFNLPSYKKKPETSDERKERIRKQNSERNTGKRPADYTMDPESNPQWAGGKIKNYADGGTVQSDPNSIFAPGEVNKTLPTQATMDQFDANGVSIPQTNSTPQSTPVQKNTPSSDDNQEKQDDKAADLRRSQSRAEASSYFKSLLNPQYSQGGKVKGYADGTSDGDPVTGDIDPNSPEGLAMIRNTDYTEAPRTDDPAQIEGDDQSISAKPQERPVKLKDIEEENLDEKAIETPYKDEGLEAEFKADESKDKKDSEDKDEESDRETASKEPSDHEKQDMEQSGFSGKAEGIESPKFSSSELAKAQRQRDMNNSLAQMERGAAIMGAGLGGRANIDPSLVLKSIDQQQKLAGMPVTKYKEQLANEQNDPNSSMSKAARALYGKITNSKPPENWTAADLKNIDPVLGKFITQQENLANRKDQNEKNLDFKKEKLQTDTNMKKFQIEQNVEMRRTQIAATGDRTLTKHFDSNTSKFQHWTGQIMNDPLIKQYYKGSTMAKRMFVSNGLPANLTSSQVDKLDVKSLDERTMLQVAEDAIQLNRMLTESGVPTEGVTMKLIPKNIETFKAIMKEQLGSHPTPAKQGAFIKQFLKIAANVNDLYKTEMEKRQKIYSRGTSAFADTHGQEINDTLELLHINPSEIRLTGDVGLKGYKKGIQPIIGKSESNEPNMVGPTKNTPAIDANLNKMTPDQLKTYISVHGGK